MKKDSDEITLSYSRMETDTDKSFEAFVLYRDLGFERSLQKVADLLGKSDTVIRRWSANHNWPERVALWDRAVDLRSTRQQLFDKEAAVIQQLRLAKAMQKLGLSQIEKHQKLSDESELFHIDADKAAKIAKEGAQLERLIHGDPNSIEERRGGDYDWSQLDVEELQLFKAMLLKVKRKEQ